MVSGVQYVHGVTNIIRIGQIFLMGTIQIIVIYPMLTLLYKMLILKHFQLKLNIFSNDSKDNYKTVTLNK